MQLIANIHMKKQVTPFLSKQMLLLALGLAVGLSPVTASAQSTLSSSRTGLSVSLPNGYVNISAEDMRLMSTAGEVRWMRQWDGQEWKFQPQWESLSQSWKNLTGSQSADTTAGTVSGGGSNRTVLSSGGSGDSGDGCWVWVDEDWQPTVDTAPMLAVRTTPFNRLMGEASSDYLPAQRVSVDYANLCAGRISGSSFRDTEGIRRINELYLGDSGRYAFNNRSILEQRAVQQLPRGAAASLYTQLASGRISLAPQTNAKGFRWIDRGGDWIDYNTQGQVVAYGDRNNNTVWMLHDTAGTLRGVVDANGRVLWSLHYTGTGDQQLLTEIKDYPVSSIANDLPSRSVKYEYDDKNRLIKVIDVRGNTTQYDYDAGNRITKVTDPEGRAEQLAYNGDTVKQRTAPDGGVTDYVFDYDDTNKQFISKITGPETAAGRRVEDFTHNRVGKLVRQTVNGRTDKEIRYDTGARSEINTNARGFVTRTTRNEFDQVVEVAYPDGGTLKRTYSALHLKMTEAIDELGINTQYQYDSKGNLLKTIEAAGTADERTTEYTRNSLGQLTSLTRKGRTEANGTVTPDATWQLSYDDQGQISQITDPEGHIRRTQYDRFGNLIATTDPRGHTTRYEVDADGNLVKITDALGRSRTYQRDKVGNVILAVDARGQQIQASYDALNRRLNLINPVGGIHKLQYNAQGLPIAETDEDGRINQIEYDNFERIAKQLDAKGNAVRFVYQINDGSATGQLGSLGEPTQVDYPSFSQLNRFDSRERLTTQSLQYRNAQGEQTTTSTATYDKRGQVLTETDANGNTRTHRYNALGLWVEITDALGGKTLAQYDARGNLIQLTDAKGNAYQFEVDRNNRVTQEILPLGQTTQYQYDPVGNLTQKIDPNGHTTDYRFDAANRLIEVKHTQSAGTLVRTTTYTWDAEDNLTAWSDTDHSRNQTSSAALTYDAAGRKTQEAITYPSGATLSYQYRYSLAGKKTRLTWPDGTQIDYGYSTHGELETVTIPGEGSISVSDYAWNAPKKTLLPGGGTQNRSFDGLLNLENLNTKTPSQQTTLDLDNRFGKLQELNSRNRTDTGNNLSTTKTEQFSFDADNRLTQVQTDTGGWFGTDTEHYTLDAVGNRIAHSKVSDAWQYDANNRLTQIGSGSCGDSDVTCYQWDNNGNLTQQHTASQTTQYRYDTQNRLIQVQEPNGNLIARYGYDPLNRRLWKEQFRDKDGNALAQAQRTHYLYADEGLIAEATQAITLNQDGSTSANTTPEITTQYGPKPESHFTTGMLFIKTRNSNGQDTVAYYHHDHLETPIQATDKDGNIVWSASYQAFGKATIITPQATVDKPTITSNLRLPGQYEDTETGLHYNFRRYYDPETGRYITVDPIGLEGGINTYVYAYSNPMIFYDPYGLWAWGDPLPQGLVDAAAGFGDGISGGLTDLFRNQLGVGSVNKCSPIYSGSNTTGAATLLVLGIGRLVYAGISKGYSITASSGTAASEGRSKFRRMFGGGGSLRPPNLSKYHTDDELRAGAGRTNPYVNALGAAAAIAGAKELGDNDCECNQ